MQSANGGVCRGWLAWRWVQDYGAAGAGTACLVTAELVRQKVGEVKGKANALFFSNLAGRARGGLWVCPGEGAGERGAPCGTAGRCGQWGPEARDPDGAALFEGRRGRGEWDLVVGGVRTPEFVRPHPFFPRPRGNGQPLTGPAPRGHP